MLTDTHTHLDHPYFDGERDEIVRRAGEAGVTRIINIGFNRETIESTIALAEAYDCIEAVVGWHPQDAKDCTAEDLDRIEQLLREHPKVVGIGETGLDYFRMTSPKEVQQRVFREQIRLARKLGKPLVIHNRDAHADIVAILREEKAYDVGGVMHCFSGSWEIAKLCLEMNFYLSFGGPITYKNAKQPKEVLQKTPPDRLLVETDAPYLTPHPHRGAPNEPYCLPYTVRALAALLDRPAEELARQTTATAIRVYGLQGGLPLLDQFVTVP